MQLEWRIGGPRRKLRFDRRDPRERMVAFAVGNGGKVDRLDRIADPQPGGGRGRTRRDGGKEGVACIVRVISRQRLGAAVGVVQARIAPYPPELRLPHRAPGGVCGRQAKADRRDTRFGRGERGIG